MSLRPPTLKQQAARIVVLKGLPTSGLPPKDMRQNFDALAHLPGSYKVTKRSIKVDGEEMTPAEQNLLEIGSKFTVSTSTNGVEREVMRWSVRGAGIVEESFVLTTKLVWTLQHGR